MEYLSEKTREIIGVVDALSDTLSFELGPCMAKPSTGDMAWFMLTDHAPGAANLFLLICTPDGVLCEYNFDETHHMSAATNVGQLLEHLFNMGYRRLSTEELKPYMG